MSNFTEYISLGSGIQLCPHKGPDPGVAGFTGKLAVSDLLRACYRHPWILLMVMGRHAGTGTPTP